MRIFTQVVRECNDGNRWVSRCLVLRIRGLDFILGIGRHYDPGPGFGAEVDFATALDQYATATVLFGWHSVFGVVNPTDYTDDIVQALLNRGKCYDLAGFDVGTFVHPAIHGHAVRVVAATPYEYDSVVRKIAKLRVRPWKPVTFSELEEGTENFGDEYVVGISASDFLRHLA